MNGDELDLGRVRALNRVVVSAYKGAPSAIRSYRILVSADGSEKKGKESLILYPTYREDQVYEVRNVVLRADSATAISMEKGVAVPGLTQAGVTSVVLLGDVRYEQEAPLPSGRSDLA